MNLQAAKITNVISLIGNTDLLYSKYLSAKYNTNIYIKADYQNPGKSSKDRPALFMIRDAEQRGLLKPGYTIVEASSGNTAIGLAIIARELGYQCHFFISSKCSDEKRSILSGLGAKLTVCFSSGDIDDPDSTLGKAYRFCSTHVDTFFCNQYENEANVNSHFETTGPEIWKQSNGKITHFIVGIGTCGTISGVAKFLKTCNKMIRIIGVEPVGSVLKDFLKTGKLIPSSKKYITEGIGRTFIPKIFNAKVVDDILQISDEDSILAAIEYFRVTQFRPGFSSGAVLASLDKLAEKLTLADHVVLFFPDDGSRYESKIYNKSWVKDHIAGVYEKE